MPDHEIMTVEEVAAYLRVSERTVYEWAQRSEIPCGKLGSTWRFRRNEVEKWVNQRLGQQPAPTKHTTASVAGLLRRENTLMFHEINKRDCLNALIDCLAKMPEVTDRTALERGINHREELMSTGIGLGLGVPHVRLESITDIAVAVAVSKTPIADYVSLDNQPVQVVFMIAAGREQHAQHIKLLSSLSFLFKNEQFRNSIIESKDADAIFNLLIEQS